MVPAWLGKHCQAMAVWRSILHSGSPFGVISLKRLMDAVEEAEVQLGLLRKGGVLLQDNYSQGVTQVCFATHGCLPTSRT